MDKLKGYMNKLLRVDLSKMHCKVCDLDPEDAFDYIGGSGLAAKILYDETGPETDPTGPENVLIFMTGPYTATRALSSSRYVVVSKSPLTGIFGEANSGGAMCESIKRSGFDGIIVTGRAPELVYLWINNGQFELRRAVHISGMDTFNTDRTIKAETNSGAVIACIGPAGEKQVPLAAIINDGTEARTAARCGLGAVMGSKNLKAIKSVSKSVINKAKGLSAFGTGGAVEGAEATGDMPVKNWGFTGRWSEAAKNITGTTLLAKYKSGNYYCRRCIIGCGKNVQITKGSYAGNEQAVPEYETMGIFGGSCMLEDPAEIIVANDLCNRYGLDTISTGSVIAFAIEAFENKIINKTDTDGIILQWGNAACIHTLIRMIAEQTGIGKTLGLGSKRAAEIFGGNSVEYAIHVKGLDFPAHDPRRYNSLALTYATSAIGASHQSGFSHQFERGLCAPEIGIPEPADPFEVEGKGFLAARTQDYMGMIDSFVTCKFIMFGGIGVTEMLDWYHKITGRKMTCEEFIQTGERIFNIKRLYNTNCGISRKDDTLPPRILTLKRCGEGHNPNLPYLNKMLSDYYEHRGWSETGIPKPEKLDALGILKKNLRNSK